MSLGTIVDGLILCFLLQVTPCSRLKLCPHFVLLLELAVFKESSPKKRKAKEVEKVHNNKRKSTKLRKRKTQTTA